MNQHPPNAMHPAPPPGTGAATLRRRAGEEWSPTLVRYARYLIATSSGPAQARTDSGEHLQGTVQVDAGPAGLLVRIGTHERSFASLTYLSVT